VGLIFTPFFILSPSLTSRLLRPRNNGQNPHNYRPASAKTTPGDEDEVNYGLDNDDHLTDIEELERQLAAPTSAQPVTQVHATPEPATGIIQDVTGLTAAATASPATGALPATGVPPAATTAAEAAVTFPHGSDFPDAGHDEYPRYPPGRPYPRPGRVTILSSYTPHPLFEPWHLINPRTLARGQRQPPARNLGKPRPSRAPA
jgi:hypothetical protein